MPPWVYPRVCHTLKDTPGLRRVWAERRERGRISGNNGEKERESEVNVSYGSPIGLYPRVYERERGMLRRVLPALPVNVVGRKVPIRRPGPRVVRVLIATWHTLLGVDAAHC